MPGHILKSLLRFIFVYYAYFTKFYLRRQRFISHMAKISFAESASCDIAFTFALRPGFHWLLLRATFERFISASSDGRG